MNSRYLMIGVVFVFCLSLAAESKISRDKPAPLGKNVRPKSGLAYSYPTPVLESDLYSRFYYNKDRRQKHYGWRIHPILAFGVENFLSYAAHFCKYETLNGSLEVVSVGSGRGTIENDIIAAYANHFGGELNITLVDPDPTCRVDFRTVDDLLAERANVVGNCVLFIIWPESIGGKNPSYDIEAIRKLQPRAVLTMYETTGISGSSEFLACLHPSGIHFDDGIVCRPRLYNYVIREIAYQEITCDPGSVKYEDITLIKHPGRVYYRYRLVKLKRKI